MNKATASEAQKVTGSLRVLKRQCYFAFGFAAFLSLSNALLSTVGGTTSSAIVFVSGAMIFAGMIGLTCRGILARNDLRLRRLEAAVGQSRTDTGEG